MDFPVELDRDAKTNRLILKVSSLSFFGGKPIFIPEDVPKIGFFSVTYEMHYTTQEIETELVRLGKNEANAYREIRTGKVILDKPYREMRTTTFQSYHIPEELAKKERKKVVALTISCTS